MENSEIAWTGSPDDMTARSGEYTFSIHKSWRIWSWAVWKHGKMIADGNKFSEDQAKAAAINAMKEHLKKNL